MEFRILGPLQVCDAGREIDIPAARLRALLAALLLRANQVVPVEDLVARIWGNEPPGDARATAQTYVRRLRGNLGHGLVTTRNGGYQLAVAADQLDLAQFECLLSKARRAPNADAERRVLGEALALWRGPAMSNVASEVLHREEIPALNERRLGALERRIALDLDAGRHAELVGELRTLTAENPLRERFWAQLMTALAGNGRTAEALQAFQQIRTLLADELGVDPCPELQDLHCTLLHREQAEPGHPRSPTTSRRVTPAQLPSDTAGFSGRSRDLRKLSDSLATSGVRHHVWLIDGPAGVGKTALAVHWAHQARDAFPDGQLYVDLRGHGPDEPMESIEALTGFLRALGVPAGEVPPDVEGAAALYRSLLADKRTLVVLDNAADPGQVRPLIPGGRDCVVLVTGRVRLTGLIAREGARLLALDVLDEDEARMLLAELIGDRVKTQTAAAAELAELCGQLPLALRIAAANLAAQPDTSIAAYATQLRRADRLAALAVEGDEQSAVRAAFESSYRRLSPDGRRAFRLLALAPGPDVGEEAAAAVNGLEGDEAARALGVLCRAHLLDEYAPSRFRFHDLLRLYAIERGRAEDSEAERAAARQRLYDYYLVGANAAARRLYPEVMRLPQQPDAEPMPSDSKASRWLDTERPNLVAAATQAAAEGSHRITWLLSDTLRCYFYMGMHTVEWDSVAHAALRAAESTPSAFGQAAACLSLANLSCRLGRHDDAIIQATRALGLVEAIDWAEGRATVHSNLGAIHSEAGRLDGAAIHLRQAIAHFDKIGQSLGGCVATGNLGILSLKLGRFDEAAEQVDKAVVLNQEIGSINGEASNRAALGEIHHAWGDLDQATEHSERALTLYRSVGNSGGVGRTLCTLARVHSDAGRYDRALSMAYDALTLAEGEHRVRGDAWSAIAAVRLAQGDHQQAVEGYERAVELTDNSSDRYLHTEAVLGLAAAIRLRGPDPRARGLLHQALAIARQAGFRLYEGQALTALAAECLEYGEPAGAVDYAEKALAVHAETGHRPGTEQAQALLDAARAAGSDAELSSTTS